MELRFEGVCCRAGLPKHKKRESLRETSPLAAESWFLTVFYVFYIPATFVCGRVSHHLCR
jgi:hypothetical protein